MLKSHSESAVLERFLLQPFEPLQRAKASQPTSFPLNMKSFLLQRQSSDLIDSKFYYFYDLNQLNLNLKAKRNNMVKNKIN